jgi:Ca2+/Na+ antiporter
VSAGLTALLFVAAPALTVVSSLVLAEVVDRLGERLGLSEGLVGDCHGPGRRLAGALSSVEKDVRPAQTAPRATRHDLCTVVPALTAVVLGSIGMVNASLSLGDRWDISQIVIGTVVLASLTGLPNVLASVRLAVRGRGSAVVSESFNSNTVNLLVGVTLPAIIGGVAAPASSTVLTVWWLAGITAVTVAFTGDRGGLRRGEGVVVIGLYLAFVAVVVAM